MARILKQSIILVAGNAALFALLSLLCILALDAQPVSASMLRAEKSKHGVVGAVQKSNAADAEAVDWYGWYRDLRSYIRAQGGIWCSPETPIRIEKDGSLTTDSEDATCSVSLQPLRFALPLHTTVSGITLTVPKGTRALSRQALQEQINRQLPQSLKPSAVDNAPAMRTK